MEEGKGEEGEEEEEEGEREGTDLDSFGLSDAHCFTVAYMTSHTSWEGGEEG